MKPTLRQGKAKSFMKAYGFGGVEESAPPAAPVEACGPVPGAGYVGVIDAGPVLSPAASQVELQGFLPGAGYVAVIDGCPVLCPAALPGEAPGSCAWE